MEQKLLNACQKDDIFSVMLYTLRGVNINCDNGYPLRRSIRYNNRRIWKYLLKCENIAVNETNKYGLSALHIAARYNVVEAIKDLLETKKVNLNSKTSQGSTPFMVAIKYGCKEAIELLGQHEENIISELDGKGRKVDDLIGVSVLNFDQKQKREILDILLKLRINRIFAFESMNQSKFFISSEKSEISKNNKKIRDNGR